MLPNKLLDSFNLSGNIVPLLGGQNTSVRVNHAVLKPVKDRVYDEWVLTIIDSIEPNGYRLSKPIRSNDGTFVSQGWMCTQFESGHEENGRIAEKLQVSRLFHQDLSKINSRYLPANNDPWAKAHRIAWQKEPLPEELHPESGKIINELLRNITLSEPYNIQLVHGDLAGNILFDDILPPLVIDFSPTLAPIEYAEAILVCDCIAWQGSSISEINLLPNNTTYREMVKRAIIFRLVVEAIFAKNDIERFMTQYRLFNPIIDFV